MKINGIDKGLTTQLNTDQPSIQGTVTATSEGKVVFQFQRIATHINLSKITFSDGTACTSHSSHICQSCDSNYYKTSSTCSACLVCGTGKRETTACSTGANRVCTQNECSCTNGVVATGTACTSHSSHICISCDTGFSKDGDSCTLISCDAGKYKTGNK